MTELFQIISQFGFPIAVASYLLFRFEKKLDALEATNEEKVRRIDQLVEEIDDLKSEIIELKKVIVRRKK